MSPVRLLSPEDLDEALSELAGADLLYVDTEFHAERRYLPRLYLVQVHVVGGHTWIVDTKPQGALAPLRDALLARPWVVHGGSQDMRLLYAALGGLPPVILDTQIGAGLLESWFPAPLKDLCDRWLGLHLPKAATLSDWSRRPLTPDQLRYAGDDVALLPRLWGRLEEDLRASGRLPLAEAACAQAREQILSPPPADLSWRHIPGTTVLSRHQAAVAQELAAWREESARKLNQPARSILSDGLLTDLARHQPLTHDALLVNRRMPKRVVARHGDELLDRIARSRRRPEWAWPHPVRPGTVESRRLALLRALAEAAGHQHSWGPRLVLPELLLRDISVLTPLDRARTGELLGAWRDELAGSLVVGVLEGDLVLRHTTDVEIAPRDRTSPPV